jgi:hypothetical protein
MSMELIRKEQRLLLEARGLPSRIRDAARVAHGLRYLPADDPDRVEAEQLVADLRARRDELPAERVAARRERLEALLAVYEAGRTPHANWMRARTRNFLDILAAGGVKALNVSHPGNPRVEV